MPLKLLASTEEEITADSLRILTEIEAEVVVSKYVVSKVGNSIPQKLFTYFLFQSGVHHCFDSNLIIPHQADLVDKPLSQVCESKCHCLMLCLL